MALTPPAVAISEVQFAYPRNGGNIYTHLNLTINQGDRFGVFGPNGAGKTTLMNLMTGLLCPQSGSIKLMGQDTRKKTKEINKLFGFVPQELSFYKELTPVENLAFFGAWAGLDRLTIASRTRELLHILGLEEARNKQVQKFSGGMKRRVNLAIGMIHNPKVLFLDEPTVGVDVQTRHAIINYLKELNSNGTTLIYTSHQLNEAEDLCNEMALVDEGKIVAQGSINDLLETYKTDSLEHLFLNLTGKSYRN
jgi:ABC-2 type transport system ATP-binding protein